MPTDEEYLRRAMRLAMNGRGITEPNPSVGCILVKNDRIIGEGYTQPFGGPHAEPTALANCTESPQGATAYVTLEPCCHTNKKTPPCVPQLINAKIARVVVGCLDPNPDVNGKGLAQLRAAGIQVDGPLLEAECKQLIAAFISSQPPILRPYYTLKWAETADGKIAGANGQKLQISNPRSTQAVHQLRPRSDAVVVGINTVLMDDPLLTPRDVPVRKMPVRFVLDHHLRIPENSRLIKSINLGRVVIACGLNATTQKEKHLESLGIMVWPMPDLWRLHAAMRIFNITHALVEPGPTLARAFFTENLADRLWVIRSRQILNDPTAPTAALIPKHFMQTTELDLEGDTLTEYLNTQSPAYFATVPSADIQLV